MIEGFVVFGVLPILFGLALAGLTLFLGLSAIVALIAFVLGFLVSFLALALSAD